MENALISVVIPVYNTEQYVGRCIESVINQTYKNLEILLIDDGSTDGSNDICKDFSTEDDRIRLLVQGNQGLSGARNTGIAHARGKYIFLLDSDDYLEINALDILLDEMIATDSDIACCAARLVFEDGASEPYTREERFLLNKEEALFHCMFCDTVGSIAWGKLYKANLFDNIKYPYGRRSEDEFVTYQLVEKAERVVYTGMYLYNYFQRKSGLVQSGETEKHLDFFDAWLERKVFLRKRGYDELADRTGELIVREAYRRIFQIQDEKRLKILHKAVSLVQAEVWQFGKLSMSVRLKMQVKILIMTVYMKWKLREA